MFWDVFYGLCCNNGIKPNNLAQKLNFSSALCTEWKKGNFPNGKKLITIADYFNVSVDYLLGREKPSVPPENFTSQEQEFIFQFRKLSLLEQAKIAKKMYKNS